MTAEERNRSRDAERPDFFGDLNLDQVVAAAIQGREHYDLLPFFYSPLREIDAITYRHEVMRDLESAALFAAAKTFAAGMRDMRECLAQLDKRFYELQKHRWFLDAVQLYVDAVNRLDADLSATAPASRGLSAFARFIAEYVSSERFRCLAAETKGLLSALGEIRYLIMIRGGRVTVLNYQGSPDYNAEITATFSRFQQGTAEERSFKFSSLVEMDHIESQVLDGVAFLHPKTFADLASFREANSRFLDATVAAFDREVQFYIGYLEHIEKFKQLGLTFAYPNLSDTSKAIFADEAFDLALAGKLAANRAVPVTNDVLLAGPERIIVVSGPNQGGKTTFARTIGQLHYLASLGLSVPARKATLFVPDRIFTHFERQEQMTSLRGKLEDEILRIRGIIQAATPRSIIVINEIFNSTALRDAVSLSKKIAAKLVALDVICVWVTFIEEVASLGSSTVSMVSTIVPDNPAQRTFKILRRPADGLAYAMSIAEKYRLTQAKIRERVAHEGTSPIPRP